MTGFMYILLCSNGQYYTGSTNDLKKRLAQHQNGEGANFTKKHVPVKLVYMEEFQRIDYAFHREKQVQGWSRKKKEALINGNTNQLHLLAECKNESHFRNALTHNGDFDSAQSPDKSAFPSPDRSMFQSPNGHIFQVPGDSTLPDVSILSERDTRSLSEAETTDTKRSTGGIG
jgi:putative endonuclease